MGKKLAARQLVRIALTILWVVTLSLGTFPTNTLACTNVYQATNQSVLSVTPNIYGCTTYTSTITFTDPAVEQVNGTLVVTDLTTGAVTTRTIEGAVNFSVANSGDSVLMSAVFTTGETSWTFSGQASDVPASLRYDSHTNGWMDN